MIERFLKKDLSKRRWRAFKKQKLAIYSAALLLIISFFSFTAEFWANDKPIYLKFKGESYFPTLIKYHPKEFGQNDIFITNYRALEESAESIIWPPIQWNPYESNKGVLEYPAPPSTTNIMGTDNQGRDIFTRLLYGFRYSMTYSFCVWLSSLIIAIILGGAMGYFGGWVDLTGQRLVEIMDTIPVLFILLILVSIFRPGLTLLVLITSFFGWLSISRYIRAEFLKLRKRNFVEVARALGGSHRRIILKHILPNSLVPIITFSPFVLASHIYGLSALDYLGFGLPPPTPSWGELLSQAKSYVTYAWWLAAFPSLALFVTLTLLALLGNGVRVAFDPNAQS